jgi:hypothetical protein
MAPNKENEDGYLTRAANYRLFWRYIPIDTITLKRNFRN